MKVGFTGTQSGMSRHQAAQLIDNLVALECTEFHHGDCIGADNQADVLARNIVGRIVVHPPTNDSKRAFTTRKAGTVVRPPKPYLERNHDIVDETDVLIATPRDERVEELRSGTWATVRYARKQGKRVIILPRGKQ
jgi:hypothetical protein